MNNKDLKALVYETKKGEICMIVVDNVGNVKFAAPVAPESVISMLATLRDCGKWGMPPYILDAREWWNAMASTPGTELVYCRRPLWENMREAGRRAFYKLSPPSWERRLNWRSALLTNHQPPGEAVPPPRPPTKINI